MNDLSSTLYEAIELALTGKPSPANALFADIDAYILEEPFALWDHDDVAVLGKAYLLMYHTDLATDEVGQLLHIHLSYLYLSRAWERVTAPAGGAFSEFAATADERMLEIAKDRILLIQSAEDAFANTLLSLLEKDPAPPGDDRLIEQLKKAHYAVKLLQFADLERLDESFTDFNNDEFLLNFSNELEGEFGFTMADGRIGTGLHLGLRKFVEGRIRADKLRF